jgi:hypothetical protein
MKSRTIYLVFLGILCLWTAVRSFLFDGASPSLHNAHGLPPKSQSSQPAIPIIRPQQSQPALTDESEQPKVPPVFVPATTPRIIELRRDVLLPVREIKQWSDVMRQGDAMSELSKLHTAEAAGVLAELIFSNRPEYFKVEWINGKKQSSMSFMAMHYLYRMIENTPQPVDGAVYGVADLSNWQDWWKQNHDHLMFRDPKKPIRLPPAMRK